MVVAVKNFLFVRHFATRGNVERRYIGRTDEPICESKEPDAGFPRGEYSLFTSPMLRCVQTAGILFPGRQGTVISDLRELDFGVFEGKTADELADCPEYSAWLDTACTGDIPGGESVAEFKDRACRAFLEIAGHGGDSAAVVTHGGVVMAILERFGYPERGFYDYHLPNGGTIFRRYEDGKLVE